MIVDPDFFDHWRTRMLVDALGKDEMAPMYVMRIWAHCQMRKATRFDMPTQGVKALCRYTGDAAALESALIEAGFIQRDGMSIEVNGWAEHNAKLISNWKNGATGGRPKKEEPKEKSEEPEEKPETTEQEPTENPNETQEEPTETQEKPIREDKRRDKEHTSDKSDIPEGFARFWVAWPKTDRKVAKSSCLQRWKTKGLEACSADILKHVEACKQTKQWREGFEPAPLTYLNQRRWEDGDPSGDEVPPWER